MIQTPIVREDDGPMPTAAERQIAARGGAVKWRRVTLPNGGGKALVAIVKRPGPNGGRTVLVKRVKE